MKSKVLICITVFTLVFSTACRNPYTGTSENGGGGSWGSPGGGSGGSGSNGGGNGNSGGTGSTGPDVNITVNTDVEFVNISGTMTKAVDAPSGATTSYQWAWFNNNTSAWVPLGTTRAIPIPTNLPFGVNIFRFTATVTAGVETTTVTEYKSVTVDIPMVRVTGGSFMRGQNLGLTNPLEQPLQLPIVSTTVSSFYVGIHEVTQGLFGAIMGFNPSHFQGSAFPPAPGERQERRPVDSVTWFEAIEFANRLSIITGLNPVYEINGERDPDNWLLIVPSLPPPGTATGAIPAPWNNVYFDQTADGFRLLTEAEWEFAAKGGTAGLGNPYSFSGSDNPNLVAWFSGTVGSPARTREVGRLMPNGLGIFDMSGNVWEWVYDWRDTVANGYTNVPNVPNPKGIPFPGGNAVRVARGGAFNSSAALNGNQDLRSTRRGDRTPLNIRASHMGFRIARNAL